MTQAPAAGSWHHTFFWQIPNYPGSNEIKPQQQQRMTVMSHARVVNAINNKWTKHFESTKKKLPPTSKTILEPRKLERVVCEIFRRKEDDKIVSLRIGSQVTQLNKSHILPNNANGDKDMRPLLEGHSPITTGSPQIQIPEVIKKTDPRITSKPANKAFFKESSDLKSKGVFSFVIREYLG